ncbi:MAG: hypothetical protein AB1Z19_05935 [Eubacteriales bacterium]
MAQESFINEFRKKDQEDLSKRWATASKSEIEAYIAKLQKQVKDTESVFQERHEDLRGSLLAITRERDELLKKVHDIQETPAEAHEEEQQAPVVQADLEQLLSERELVAMPKDVFEKLKNMDTKNTEKLEQIEYALGQTKMQYQKLLVQHQMTQEENQNLSKEKSLLEGAAFQIQANSQSERELIISHYKSIQESQHTALVNLKEVMETTLQMINSMINIDAGVDIEDIKKRSG